MLAKPTLDANLLQRAERAIRDTTAFLDESRGAISKMVIRIPEEKILETATSEARRATESGLGLITLSSHDLTPGMHLIAASISEQYSAWKGNVDKQADSLSSTIGDINNEAIDIANNELPALEASRVAALNKADRDFETATLYQQNRAEYADQRGRFEKLKGYNKGNYPKRFPPQSAYIAFLFIIGLGDVYINYGVFLSKFETAIAMIVTVFVGFVVAVASHVHGKYLKQHKIISLDIDAIEKKGEKRAMLIATGAFVICLVVIFWARYSYFTQGAGLDFGMSGAPFIITRIGPTLFFNFLIWFVGAVISYWVHERVPGLKETHKRWIALDAEFEGMREILKQEKDILERTYGNEKNALEGRLAERRSRLTNLRAMKEQLDKLDKNYRSQISAQGSSLLRSYAQILADQVVGIEHDPSALAFMSPKKGRLTLLEFSAADFIIPLEGK